MGTMRNKKSIVLLFYFLLVLLLCAGIFALSVSALDEPHKHDGVTFEKWTSTNSLPTSGNYYLTCDVTVSSTTTVTEALNLCLDGHDIVRTGATGADNSGIVITVNDGADLTIIGPGKITGGSGFHGGGIHVEGNSSLVLSNCEISGNAGHYGGGLYLKNGTITLKNGTIVKNNSASEGFGGSGIYAEGGGTLILENCIFTGNELKNGNQYAVFLAGNANVKVSGAPVVYDNTYNGEQKNLYLYQASGQDSKVLVTGLLTDGAKIGVRQGYNTGTFTSGWSAIMGDANPSKYFISDNGAYIIDLSDGEAAIKPHEHNGLTFTKWTSTNSLPNEAGSYYLTADVTISSTWNVPSGTTNLCLNGHGIRMTGSDSVISVGNGNVFNLYDCDAATEHKFTVSNPAANGAGLAIVNDAATGEGVKTFTGGYITGGSASPYGGGVRVAQYGKFNMYGGTIIGNTASSHGGGVSVSGAGLAASNTKNFVMSGGAICYNAASWGGGVAIYGEAYISGDGVIFKNTASGGGGGIELESNGKLYMDGGSVTENLLSGQNAGMWKGAGVHLPGGAEFHLKGAAQITNNYQSDGTTPSNVFVRDGLKIAVETLSENIRIGIGMQSTTGAFTSGWSTYMVDGEGAVLDPADYFVPDSSNCEVRLENGEAEICKLNFIVVIDGVTTYFDNYDDAFKAWCSGELGTIKIFESDDLTSEAIAQGATSVSLTIETKTEDAANHAEDIIENAKNKSALTFFDVKVEKTVDEETTLISETNHVIEVIVPYEKINKRGLTVYSYHDSQVRTFVEGDTKEDGTFRVDKENNLIYIYAKKFSTYAIGYTPYYRVQTSLSLGSYVGNASVTIKNVADENITFTLESVNANQFVFPDVPKGQYTMTVTWEDGKTNMLTMMLTVGPKAVISAIEKQEAPSEEQITQLHASRTSIGTGVYMDSGYENPVFMQVSLPNKAQEAKREISFIPRKRYC